MNVLLFCLAVGLMFVNLFAIMCVIVQIGVAYKIGNSFSCIIIILSLSAIINVINILLVAIFGDSNKNGLSALIQIGILVICALLILIFDKIDYKRNVKPNLQIKL